MTLTDQEVLAALVQEERQRLEREAHLDSCGATQEQVTAWMEAKGIKPGTKRFCWLRLRRHRYIAWFMTGTYRRGHTWKLCGNCGHTALTGYCGDAELTAG